MNPPLRTEEDRQYLVKALKEGIVDVIATDHAPHISFSKLQTLQEAPFGTIGLETALPIVYYYLVHSGIISILDLVKLFSFNPSVILRLPNKGHLSVGADADITVFDPKETFIITEEFFISKSKNSCFIGMEAKGKVKYTFVSGKLVYSD